MNAAKIQALRALAEHPDTPPHEAASAREKVARLVERDGESQPTGGVDLSAIMQQLKDLEAKIANIAPEASSMREEATAARQEATETLQGAKATRRDIEFLRERQGWTSEVLKARAAGFPRPEKKTAPAWRTWLAGLWL